MSRNRESIYLDLKDGELISAASLMEAIEQHPDIKTVVLFWKWTRDYYTSNAGPFSAYVTECNLDEEYSFFGGRDEAMIFADNYDCWDGEDFVLLKVSDGLLLYGFRDEYDMQTSWSDGYDHINGLGDGKDPSWFAWLRVDMDYKTGTEYLLSPDPIPDDFIREEEE